MITYKKGIIPDAQEIKALNDDASWSVYTANMDRLMRGIKNSLLVITAWDNDRLVALIRIVGDGATIVFMQDLIVLKAYKRKGIGTHLVNLVCDEYESVWQKVLLTDDTAETRVFMNPSGFHPVIKGNTCPL